MKLTPTRPVTIYSRQHGQVWFPQLHRHIDGTLFIYFEKGYDRAFSPFGRLRSFDHGRTWIEEKENVPRASWAYSFSDGELFEMDWYGVVDPHDPHVSWRQGAWSFPTQPDTRPRRNLIRVDSPSTASVSAEAMGTAYPTHQWWELINRVHGKTTVTGAELRWDSVVFFRWLEHDGVMLGLAAGPHRDDEVEGEPPGHGTCSMFCFESHDRGRSWTERSLIARGRPDLPEGFSEGTFVPLKDGRLYAVMRTGASFHQVWSSDGGHTWEEPEVMKLVDSDMSVGMCWPCLHVCADGTLLMVWGRHGKHMVFDPSGSGTRWQGHLDLHAWELDTQELMGVPPELRLRGDTVGSHRHLDSGDMPSLVEIEPHTFLVCYDVQSYHEHWNSPEFDGAIRMVRVNLG